MFSAVHRTLIDACRTILVWMMDLLIFYAFDKVIIIYKDKKIYVLDQVKKTTRNKQGNKKV